MYAYNDGIVMFAFSRLQVRTISNASQQTAGLMVSSDASNEPSTGGTTSRPTVTADTVERSHQALPSVRFYGRSKWLPSRYADQTRPM